MSEEILVIRHGALGDIVLSTGPFAAIRRHHADARITLLTTKPYATLLRKSPYFNDIWIDEKPKFWQLRGMIQLYRLLNSRRWTMVYDLQTSTRSSFYHRLLRGSPPISGIASGDVFRHDTPERTRSHTLDRQAAQLEIAGIDDIPPPDVSWLAADAELPALPKPYALIVAGGSAHRPEKRWPAQQYGALCSGLSERGILPVLLGTEAEGETLLTVEACSPARNLCGQTGFATIVALAQEASFAIGNDTGPMHLIAAAGCPSIVLFCRASNPALCAPRGKHVTIIRRDPLSALSVEEVMAALPAGSLDTSRLNAEYFRSLNH